MGESTTQPGTKSSRFTKTPKMAELSQALNGDDVTASHRLNHTLTKSLSDARDYVNETKESDTGLVSQLNMYKERRECQPPLAPSSSLPPAVMDDTRQLLPLHSDAGGRLRLQPPPNPVAPQIPLERLAL